jgi:solute carrier family 25 (mitochondrial phosphate transporter), member 3
LGKKPADTLLSQINKGHGPKGTMMYRLATLAKEAGVKGLFAGLGPRMIMTAGLVSSQFVMYGAIKEGTHFFLFQKLFSSSSFLHHPTALGAPPGIEIHKEGEKE